MSKKSLENCRSGKDFVEYAAKHGANVSGGAHHIKIQTEKGTTVCGVHGNKDLPTGTRYALIKQLRLILVLVFMGLCVAGWMMLATLYH